jgi:hypothetical protein
MKITRRQLRKLITETVADQFIDSLPDSGNSNSNIDPNAEPIGGNIDLGVSDADIEKLLGLRDGYVEHDSLDPIYNSKITLKDSIGDLGCDRLEKDIVEIKKFLSHVLGRRMLFTAPVLAELEGLLRAFDNMGGEKNLLKRGQQGLGHLVKLFRVLKRIVSIIYRNVRGARIDSNVNSVIKFLNKIEKDLGNKLEDEVLPSGL